MVTECELGCQNGAPDVATSATLVDSVEVGEETAAVAGADWTKGSLSLDSLTQSFLTSGFQATQLGQAIKEIQRMRSWRPDTEDINLRGMDPNARCFIWLSFTSNMISSGLRDVFVYLAKEKLVDAIVTSAGGVEEDFIKSLAPTYLGSFDLKGADLREKGWNRIGNLIIPNRNYCSFEDWVQPLLDKCLELQRDEGVLWTPSSLIDFLGKSINSDDSLYYWCHKNGIPVFCPGITDGSLGDNLYFHSYRNPGLVVDVVRDTQRINDVALAAPKSGMIILGGGVAKHHTCIAQLVRNGADYAVFINTGQEYDGCDSGAAPSEAVSWGYIKSDATPVKVFCDATVAFPLITASAFSSDGL